MNTLRLAVLSSLIATTAIAAPPKGPMTDAEFEHATAAFKAHASSVLHLPPDRMDVGPVDPQVATMMTITGLGGAQVPLGVGRGVGFDARDLSNTFHRVRGWAFADGTVATYRQNLDRFLDESKGRSASEVAALLVWSMGPGHRLVDTAKDRPAPPRFEGKTLRFVVAYTSPGPALSPSHQYDCTVTHAGHVARLQRSANLVGPDDSPQGLFVTAP